MKTILAVFLTLLSIAIGFGVLVLLALHTDLRPATGMTIVGIIVSICLIISANIVKSNPLDMCNSCLNIWLGSMTIRKLIDSDIFQTLDGKSVLVFHLFHHNCCTNCKVNAKNHLQTFVNSKGLNFDVEKYYNSLVAKKGA